VSGQCSNRRTCMERFSYADISGNREACLTISPFSMIFHCTGKSSFCSALNIFLVVEGAARVIRKGVIERNEYRIKLKQIEEAKATYYPSRAGSGLFWACQCPSGRRCNEYCVIHGGAVCKPAAGTLPNSVARDVRVKLRFFEPIPAGRLLLAIDGRWADY